MGVVTLPGVVVALPGVVETMEVVALLGVVVAGSVVVVVVAVAVVEQRISANLPLYLCDGIVLTQHPGAQTQGQTQEATLTVESRSQSWG